jgi:hypothetical protein
MWGVACEKLGRMQRNCSPQTNRPSTLHERLVLVKFVGIASVELAIAVIAMRVTLPLLPEAL